MKTSILLIVWMTIVVPVSAQQSLKVKETYYCPPCNSRCDELSFDKPGSCEHCGMVLLKQTIEQRKKNMNEKKLTVASICRMA